MKQSVSLSIPLLLTLAVLVTATRAIGGTIKLSEPSVVNVLIADSALGPHAWCWRDICPGQTFVGEAVSILMNHNVGPAGRLNYSEYGYSWISSDQPRWEVALGYGRDYTTQISLIIMWPHQAVSLQLGEAIEAFGNPTNVILCPTLYYNGVNGIYIRGYVFFRNGVSVAVGKAQPFQDMRVTPDMLISTMRYEQFDKKPFTSIASQLAWKGFTIYSPQCGL